MTDPSITLRARDATKAAFESAKRNLASMKASAEGLALPFRNITVLAAGLGTVLATVSLKSTINAADELAKLKQRTGIAVEELSALKFAGELADVSMESLAGGLSKLNVNIAAAARGEKEQAEAFQALGVAVKDANGQVRSADDVLGDISDKFAQYADGPNKAAIGNAIFGRSYAQLIPLLNGGRAGIQAAREELEKFGGVISDDLASKSEQFNDNITRLGVALDSLKVSALAGLIDTLVEVSEKFVEASRNGKGFLDVMGDVFSGRATSQLAGFDPFGLFGDDFAKQVTEAERAVGRLRKLRDEAASASGADSASAVLRSELPQLEAKLKAAEQRLQALRAGAGRGAINPPLPAPDATKKEDAPALPDDQAKAAAARAAAEALAEQRKLTDGRIKALQDGLAAERDVLTFREQFLRGVYDAGNESLRQFYAAQDALRQQDLDAQIAAFAAEEAELQKLRGAKGLKPADRADIDNKVEAVRTKAAAAQREFDQQQQLSAQAREAQTRALQEQVSQLDAQIASLAGDRAGAALIEIQRKVLEAEKLLAQSGGDPARAQELGRLLEVQRQFSTARAEFADISDRAFESEERLLLAAQRNGTGLLDTERQLRDARARSVDELDALIDKTRDLLALNPGDASLVRFLRDIELQADRARDAMDPLKLRLEQAAGDIGRNAAENITDALIDGDWKSAGEAIGRNLMRAILSDTVTEPLTREFTNFLKNGLAGSDTVGGMVGGAIGRLFGGDASTAGRIGDAATTAEVEQLGVGLPQLGDAAVAAAENVTSMGAETAVTSAVVSAMPGVAVTPAAASLGVLKLAADHAAAALLNIGSSKDLSSLASLFGGGGFGTGNSFGNQDLGLFLHSGGVVGESRDMRPVPAGLFGDALKPDEVPTVLLRNEEVLTRDDPRHRMNLGLDVFERIQAMKIMETERSSNVIFRYHTGGLVGRQADAAPLMRSAGAAHMETEWRHEKKVIGAGGVIVNVIGARSEPKVTQRETPSGRVIDIVFEEVRGRLAEDWANGGPSSDALGGAFGVSRAQQLRR